jgi:hypothetical protein
MGTDTDPVNGSTGMLLINFVALLIMFLIFIWLKNENNFSHHYQEGLPGGLFHRLRNKKSSPDKSEEL